MFWLTLRNIRGRKLRYVLTTLAVVLGVAFMSTSFFLTDRIRDTFDELAVDITGDLDLVVRTAVGEGDRINRLPVPEDLLEVVNTDVPGVAAVAPVIRAWNVIPITVNDVGRPEAVTTQGAPQFGLNYFDIEPLTQFYLVDGRAPLWIGPIEDPDTIGEFILDTRTAEDNDFEIGQTYTVSGQLGNRRFILVGVANWGSPDKNKSPGATMAAFEERTAQTFLGREGIYDEIHVALEDGADPATVAAEIQADLDAYRDRFSAILVASQIAQAEAALEAPGVLSAIPEDLQNALASYADVRLEVVDAATITEENRDDFSSFIDIISYVLLTFAVIAVLVSAFIINNTFSIVLGQRVRELALLRVLGATARQIARSVVLEALVIGAVAAVAGLAGGYALALGLRELLESLGSAALPGTLPIRLRTIIIATAVGIGATVLSSLGPAHRIRSIAPVAALRDQPGLTPASLTRRLLGGGVIVLAGVVMLATGMFAELATRPGLFLLGAGALVAFVGVYLLSPVAARPVANLLGRPIQRLFRIPGRLARENAGRRPRRTAATAAALTVGLALVCLAAVVGDSIKTTAGRIFDDSISSDLFISGATFGPGAGFSADLVADMVTVSEQRPDLIDSAIGYRFVFDGMTVDGSTKEVLSTDLSLLADHMDLDLVDGDVAGPAAPGTYGTILIHVDPATDRALAIGDPVTVVFGANRKTTLTTAAIFRDASLLGNWVVDDATFDYYIPQAQPAFASVVYSPDADPETARAAIEALTDEYPQLTVEDQREYRKSMEAQLDQVLAIITVFLGLSLLIAVLGITNTLALSVYEQTRELGLLRAVGMTRRQMRRMVRWEAVIIALFGGLLGVAIGVLFGFAAVSAIPGIDMELSIPVRSLVVYLLVSGVFGVLAAILPAYRASRLNILEAIYHQ